MASLIVLRHGQAEGNTSHRFIGQYQMALTPLGASQAEMAADRLARLDVTRILSSDLDRCTATARPLAERLGMDLETTPELREIHNGEWTGLEPAEISHRWPDMWSDYAGGVDVARPGGERWEDVAGRILPIARRLLDGEAGTVVVSTHGGPSLILAAWAAGVTLRGNIFRGPLGSLDNASLTMIDPGPRLISFNDVGHLHTGLPDTRLPFEEV